jgi:hypothetical protein
MSEITDRIADALRQHTYWTGFATCQVIPENWIQPIAAAVVEELGLRLEEGADFTGGGQTRYVTEWVDDV